MRTEGGALGVFGRADQLLAAVRVMRAAGFTRIETYSPHEIHGLDEALGRTRPSPVRVWTLVGGLAGLTTGLALPAWTSSVYGLVVGGKPVVSWLAFLVVGFELMVLGGALATLVGFVVHAMLGSGGRGRHYDVRFGADRFGLWVPCEPAACEQASSLLTAAGAEEVQVDAAVAS